jgi:ubiquitin carboxyl-terminal hydrolase 16
MWGLDFAKPSLADERMPVLTGFELAHHQAHFRPSLTMPDKTLKVVTYAAGASLAAITLVYVFAPTYFLDSDASASGSAALSTRKKGVVGLSNPANDCFINSVLQALAGLGDLRLYLIREIHRRSLDDESVYAQLVPADILAQIEDEKDRPRFGKDIPNWKLEGLQRGSVTRGLKEILDALNERPIYKKTISAARFVKVLEEAFRQRISRQQQDAQEFLQVVAERLCDEYHAGRRARWLARRAATLDGEPSVTRAAVAEILDTGIPQLLGPTSQGGRGALGPSPGATKGGLERHSSREEGTGAEEEEGFPLEGRFESQIECLTCGFKPRPTASTFCTLTLNVPRVSSTTLGACFDDMFKIEYIDDFKCEKCRLLHALSIIESEARRSTSEAVRAKAQATVEKLKHAIEADPEKPPEDVQLPDSRSAPKRKIRRHIRLIDFPKVLAIHLSRSIFDASYSSQKNSAKVAFPEQLPLGGLLQQRKYKLLGVVTHKGSHSSGHYESFRRQNMYPPFSNPSTFQASEAYSRRPSPASTPRREDDGQTHGTPTVPASVQELSANGINAEGPSCPDPGATDAGSPRSSLSDNLRNKERPADTRDHSASAPPGHRTLVEKPKWRKQQARWWRISDEKIKEASTRDVLSMQREVYLLFYEIERQPS